MALLPHSDESSLNVSRLIPALHHSDFSNTLIYALTNSGTLQTYGIIVRFLNLLASENGGFVNIILLCVPRRLIKEVEVLPHYYSKPALQELPPEKKRGTILQEANMKLYYVVN